MTDDELGKTALGFDPFPVTYPLLAIAVLALFANLVAPTSSVGLAAGTVGSVSAVAAIVLMWFTIEDSDMMPPKDTAVEALNLMLLIGASMSAIAGIVRIAWWLL